MYITGQNVGRDYNRKVLLCDNISYNTTQRNTKKQQQNTTQYTKRIIKSTPNDKKKKEVILPRPLKYLVCRKSRSKQCEEQESPTSPFYLHCVACIVYEVPEV